MFGNFKFKPFKHYSSDKRKLSRKKHNFDLAKSDFYPPEGHSCTNLLAGDDTKKYFFVHGGARRTEEATWFSASDLYVIEIEYDEDDVDMTSVTKATVSLSLTVLSANYIKVMIIKLKLPDPEYLCFPCGDRF